MKSHYVIETSEGTVRQVIPCESPDEAILTAKELCEKNDLAFEGSISTEWMNACYNGSVGDYSIQIFPHVIGATNGN